MGNTQIVVPDDFPAVFEGSVAHERAKALGAVRVCGERGADNAAELARRIGGEGGSGLDVQTTVPL